MADYVNDLINKIRTYGILCRNGKDGRAKDVLCELRQMAQDRDLSALRTIGSIVAAAGNHVAVPKSLMVEQMILSNNEDVSGDAVIWSTKQPAKIELIKGDGS